MEEQLVHLPELCLPGSCLGRGGCGWGVRVDVDEREMPEREADAAAELPLDVLDRAKRLP